MDPSLFYLTKYCIIKESSATSCDTDNRGCSAAVRMVIPLDSPWTSTRGIRGLMEVMTEVISQMVGMEGITMEERIPVEDVTTAARTVNMVGVHTATAETLTMVGVHTATAETVATLEALVAAALVATETPEALVAAEIPEALVAAETLEALVAAETPEALVAAETPEALVVTALVAAEALEALAAADTTAVMAALDVTTVTVAAVAAVVVVVAVVVAAAAMAAEENMENTSTGVAMVKAMDMDMGVGMGVGVAMAVFREENTGPDTLTSRHDVKLYLPALLPSTGKNTIHCIQSVICSILGHKYLNVAWSSLSAYCSM
ncbi:uncharacterized protein LOC115432601 isoform X2 [Sphaeramia orbicularis]|uniref:uncharacterized protein LOC115432601 isoform X2 n=1 Tax=Sphaeramia orbicularis TaxID=375764 RepID=UPI00117F1432|nr:uncharacterized protein LOC115432601 isoform X2 [Sphaeramia orbicularis]